MTDLADKQEALVGPVGIGGMAAYRTGLARVVRVHLDRHTPAQQGFIGDHAVQLSEGPLGIRRIGLALLLACLFAPSAAARSFANVGQLFQPDQAVGVEQNDACGNDMIGVGFQPSLPSADRDESPRRRTGAFLLQTLSQSGVVVGGCDDTLARMETRLPPGIAGHGQIAHAHINPDDAGMRLWRGVGYLNFQRDQQVELFPGLVIPEFGRPDGRAVLY